MPPTGLKNWPDIAGAYTQSFLIGNGASIAFSAGFHYKDLLGYAGSLGLLTPEISALFKHFNTTDFELVLRLVWQAHELNAMLRIQEAETHRAYDALRDALIRVVRQAHPPYDDVALKLAAFASLLRHFDTVISLNYDLILYWAHMYSNNMVPSVAFKDCFIDGVFRNDWQTLRQSLPGTSKSILVFYPHGNLALGVSPDGSERKIHVSDSLDLLTQLEARWQHDRWLPLFVSEGTSQEKLASVYRSTYLATVLQEVLLSIGVSLAVFGWSFGEADDHILRAILGGRLRRIAVSVHTSNPDWRDFREDVRRRVRKASRPGYRPHVEFFDAETMPLTTNPLPPL